MAPTPLGYAPPGPPPPHPGESWHLDKRVPISLIVALSVQLFGGAYYIGQLESRMDKRVSVLEAQLAAQHERDVRQDENVNATLSAIQQRFDRLDGKLDRLIEKGAR